MKKIIISFFITLIFVMSFIPNTFAAYNVSERVRIGIRYGSSAVSNPSVYSTSGSFDFARLGDYEATFATIKTYGVSLSQSSSYLVVEQSYFSSLDEAREYCKRSDRLIPYIIDGNICAVFDELYTDYDINLYLESAKVFNPSAFIIEPDSNLIKVYNGDGFGLFLFRQSENSRLGISASFGGLMDFGESETYRGIIEFVKNGSAFNIISNVTMQEYLYAVVPAEIGSSAPLEAQKAQAVCARTYYEENINKHKSDGFSLCNTTHCQVYAGTKNEHESSTTAVDTTYNQIITYNGKPISAVYFAHSGGKTANSEDVWVTALPYLKSVEDEYCKNEDWELEISLSSLTTKMNNRGYNLGEVTSVDITKVTDYGMVTEIRINGTNGSKTFAKDNIRSALGVKSQHFSIMRNNSSLFAQAVAYLLNERNIPHSLSSGGSGIIKITGRGNGHTVGFSQHGAMGYADAGWDYISILKHYYQGVTIEGE